MGCLDRGEPDSSTSNPTIHVTALEGAAIVNMPLPGTVLIMRSKCFHHNNSRSASDIVWDKYSPDSLKAETHTKRGNGICRCVEPSIS